MGVMYCDCNHYYTIMDIIISRLRYMGYAMHVVIIPCRSFYDKAIPTLIFHFQFTNERILNYSLTDN